MATGESKKNWSGADLGSALTTTSLSELSISYHGKQSEDLILKTPPSKLRPLDINSSDEPNQLYFGENLGILAALSKKQDIKGNVRLIYIDPPYATNSVFKSRNRNDAYQDLLLGTEYIEFLRTRLLFLYELLAENGSIYVHLDSNMIFHIKIILDEIFGAQNFRAVITRQKSNPKNYTRKTFGNISDYILFYTKSEDYLWNRAYKEWTEESIKKEYPCLEEETGRRFKKVPIHAPGKRNGDTGQEWRGMLPPSGKHWQYRRETLDEMDARGEIYWSPTGNPRRKVYLDQSDGIPVQDIWLDTKDAHNQNIKITGYPTEKPLNLLKRIVCASSNEGDLVLDCFCGSGTTLDAASQTNRRWIGIDASAEAIKTVLDRFRNGLKPMGDYVNRAESKQISLPFEFDEARESDSHTHVNDEFQLLVDEFYDGELDNL